MLNDKITAILPVRTACKGKDCYLLFNTHTFQGIHVDPISFEAWNYITAHSGVTIEEVAKHLIIAFESTETPEEVAANFNGFFEFLQEKGFISRGA